MYYAIVGLPSLLTVSPTGIYLMRLVSCLLSTAFLALAFMSVVAWSKSRLLLIGLIVALTPTVFFLSSVVNPSGLEITSAICLWCSGLVLALERSEAPPPGLVWVAAVAAAALLLTRALSPLWLALILLLLGLLAGWRGVLSITRTRAARTSLILLVPCALFALLWIIVAHGLDVVPIFPPGSITANHLVAVLVGYTGFWIRQMVGDFGWTDTPAPLVTYLIWYGAIGLFVLMAVACAKLRHLGVLLLTLAMVLVIPVVLAYSQEHRLGIGWQERYIMPLSSGVPLLAVAILEQSDRLRWPKVRLATVLCLSIGLADFAAFTEALRRYMVGLKGPLDYLRGTWDPPLGALTLTVVAFVVIALLLMVVWYLVALSPATD